MEALITRHLYEADYDVIQTWQLAKWCQKHGADEWTLTSSPVQNDRSGLVRRFEEINAPFCLPSAKRRQLTQSRQKLFIRQTPLWRLNSTSLAALQEFLAEGLFSYPAGKGSRLEDPVFYREGEFMLGIVSHENEGVLRVTAKEFEALESLGFQTRQFGTFVGY